MLRIFTLLVLLLLPFIAVAELEPVFEARYLMGTRAEIVIYHHDSKEGRKLVQEAFSIMEALDRLLSNYKVSSELSLLNANRNKELVPVSTQMHHFLTQAKDFTKRTEGAFDITIKPLLDLWRQAAQVKQVPHQSGIASLLKKIGAKGYTPVSGGKVQFTIADLQFDSGGIGKGYAVDRAIEYLQRNKVESAFVSIGESSVRAYGTPQDRKSFSVVFKFPGGESLGMLDLNDVALSASNSHSQSVQIGDVVYSHLIDPRTGYPLLDNVQAAVIAKTATEAEALTKYLAITRPDLQELQKKWRGVEGYIRADGRVQTTEGFVLSGRSPRE